MFAGGKSYLRYDIKCNQLKFHYQVNFFKTILFLEYAAKKVKRKKKKKQTNNKIYMALKQKLINM